MIIVGGTYTEAVDIPAFGPEKGGSGLRGATAIGSRCDQLVTALAGSESLEAPRTRILERSESVSFSYFTSLSTPRISGFDASVADRIVVDDDGVLVYGMIEDCDVEVRASRVVVDPQSPKGNSRGRLSIDADEQILSGNAREIAGMLASPKDPRSNAAAVRDLGKYAAVILRAGAQGCFVADESGVYSIPSHPTINVWPLGSGDTFSASFASAWMHGADIVEAAHIGSNATAWWCGTRKPFVPGEILDSGCSVEEVLGVPAHSLVDPRYQPAIYLAAPFFTVAERWLVDLVFATLQGLGARPFSPFHHVGVGGDDVAELDIAGLEQCDSVLALLDHYDAGTLFETGWASARQIPVLAFRSDHNTEGDKMLVGLGAEIHSDLATAVYRSAWAALGANLTPGRHTLVEAAQ